MTTTGKPSAPRLSNPTEISCEVEWDVVEGAAGYALLVKSVGDDDKPWSEAARHEHPAGVTRAEIEGLEPTNTYIVRLVAKNKDGVDSEMSEEAFIDTLVAGCSGTKGENNGSKGCCLLM